MAGKAVVRFADYGGERSNAEFPILDLTALNIADTLTDFTSLKTALEGITVDLQVGYFIGNDETIVTGSAARASSALAQRENKWLLRWHDDNGSYTMTVPCADLTILDPNNRGFANIASGAGATFKTAFEAIVATAGGGTPVLDSMEFVGRNL